MTTVYLNGEYLPHERAVISPDERGFIFGDGIYEVVRVIGGRIYEWDAHAARMARGLAALRLAFGPRDVAALRGVSERLVGDNGIAEGGGTVCLQVSRGAAPRAHQGSPGRPPGGAHPHAGTPPPRRARAAGGRRGRRVRGHPAQGRRHDRGRRDEHL